MDIQKELEQMFVDNLGNKISVELANGMLQKIMNVIAEIQQPEQKAE